MARIWHSRLRQNGLPVSRHSNDDTREPTHAGQRECTSMTQDRHHTDTGNTPWVSGLTHLATSTQPSAESRVRTVVSCDIRSGRKAMFVPPDMPQLQPRSLQYLRAFALTHDLQLVEDRRRVTVTPVRDMRNSPTPAICKALGELLQQLGLPGATRLQSWPHRLGRDSQHIEISKLIKMAAFAAPKAKRSSIELNASLKEVINNKADTIDVYGCKLVSEEISAVLGIFETTGFRAVGYSTGKQYVIHICLAGGELSAPELWADFHLLSSTDFRLQLHEARDPSKDVGLFYTTVYLDLSEAPTPWWLNTWAENTQSAINSIEPYTLQQTG